MIFCEEQFPALVTNDSGMLLPLSTNSKPWSEKLRCDFGQCIRNADILECVFSQSSSLDKYQIPKKKNLVFFEGMWSLGAPSKLWLCLLGVVDAKAATPILQL